MKPTAPANSNGDAVTCRLEPTWKTQVDLSRLTRPDSQVYCWETCAWTKSVESVRFRTSYESAVQCCCRKARIGWRWSMMLKSESELLQWCRWPVHRRWSRQAATRTSDCSWTGLNCYKHERSNCFCSLVTHRPWIQALAI